MSQQDLADLVGSSQQMIARLEKNDSEKSSSRLYYPIAKALKISFDWLMEGASSTSNADNVEEVCITADSALNDAINSVKAIRISKGESITHKDLELLKEAFRISFRGKFTGDYVTAALQLKGLKQG